MDEVILLGLNWLRGLPRGICADEAVKDAAGLPNGWPAYTPLVHKLLALAMCECSLALIACILEPDCMAGQCGNAEAQLPD